MRETHRTPKALGAKSAAAYLFREAWRVRTRRRRVAFDLLTDF